MTTGFAITYKEFEVYVVVKDTPYGDIYTLHFPYARPPQMIMRDLSKNLEAAKWVLVPSEKREQWKHLAAADAALIGSLIDEKVLANQ